MKMRNLAEDIRIIIMYVLKKYLRNFVGKRHKTEKNRKKKWYNKLRIV